MLEHDRTGAQITEFTDASGRTWLARFRPSRGLAAGDPSDPLVLEFLPLEAGVRLGMIQEMDLHSAGDRELQEFLKQARSD